MRRVKLSGLSETLVVIVLMAAVVCAAFPQVVFGGASILSTDAIFAVEPWRSEAPRARGDVKHPYNGDLGDHDFQFFPLLVEIQRQIHAGETATWTPHAYAGAPLEANVQLARYDLFHLLLPWFQDRDGTFDVAAVSRGLSVTGLLRLWLCLIFSYAWLRRLGGGAFAAFLGALFVGLGPYASVWRLHTPEQVMSWWPVALFFLDGLVRGGSLLSFGGFAFALVASQLGGYPQTSLFFGAFCVVYAVARALPGRAKAAVLSVVIAGLFSLIVCAPVFVPWFAYVKEGGFRLQRELVPLLPTHTAFGTQSVLGFVLFGLASTGLVVWALFGRMGATRRGALLAVGVFLAWFAGGDGQAPLLLFGEGRGHPLDADVRPIAGKNFTEMVQDHVGACTFLVLGAFARPALLRGLALVLAVGSSWPFLQQGLRLAVPWLEPSRAACLVPITVAAGMVLALRRAALVPAEEREAAWRRSGVVLAAAYVAYESLSAVTSIAQDLIVAGAGPRGAGLLGYHWHTGSFIVVLLIAAAVVVPRIGRARELLRSIGLPFAVTSIGVVLAIALTWNFQPRIEPRDIYPVTPTVAFLENAQRADPDARVFATAGDAFRGNALQTFGISDVFALDGIEPEHFLEWLLYLDYPKELPQRGTFRAAQLSMLGTQVFDLLGARYVVATKGDALPAHFRVVHEGPAIVVAENPSAAPRCWLTTTTYDLDSEPTKILEAKVTEHVGVHATAPALGTPRMQQGRASVVRRGPDRLDIEVEADGHAWLVVRDAALAGWHATKCRTLEDDPKEANGEPIAIHQVFAGYRAVEVDADTKFVSFRYRPVGSPRLALLAALSCMVLGFSMLLMIFVRMAVWPFAAIHDVKSVYRTKRGHA
ncbi:MAG: hypothetical protein KDC95_19045 [Planctomycetes bacterium]|nr:hypothetical protein [Planctomycetota bacterium]